jgi:sec-independent protein translocase protein TatA
MFESPWHWAIVAIVAFVLFFGWKNLPDMSRSLGRSLRIFKTEIKGMGEDDKARQAKQDAESAQPKALPPADVVRRDVTANGVAANGGAERPRPRPAPRSADRTSAPAE